MRKWDKYGIYLEKGDGLRVGKGVCINIRFIDKKKMLYKFLYNMFIKINDFYYN